LLNFAEKYVRLVRGIKEWGRELSMPPFHLNAELR
jgi:hypothetical protein